MDASFVNWKTQKVKCFMFKFNLLITKKISTVYFSLLLLIYNTIGSKVHDNEKIIFQNLVNICKMLLLSTTV